MISLRTQLSQHVLTAVQVALGGLHGITAPRALTLVPPKNLSHGDYTTPICLSLAKAARKSPRELAQAVAAEIGTAAGLLDRVEIAGPGHLNLFVARDAWLVALVKTIEAGADSVISTSGQNERVLVEFVSANPTGPLHVAHGRGAVTGDVICRLMTAAGYDIEREYYINDMGHQTDVLARSVHYRYLEKLGKAGPVPEEFYPGDYCVAIAEALVASQGEALVNAPEDSWLETIRSDAVTALLARIRRDLDAFGVHFDHWVSERALCEQVGLKRLAERLAQRGHTFVKEGKTWFRSTAFGDDKDRVILRDDGRPTYFLGDIAYHDNKMQRGFARLINIFGADHGGYVTRVRAGMAALGHNPDALQVILIQMVSLSRGGEAVRMGKRLGTAVWLEDVVSEAGRDASRYLFLTRRPDAQMDFDVDLARKKTLDNPVFYAQMGHARLAAIGRKAQGMGICVPAASREAVEALVLDDEIDLVRHLVRASDVVSDAAAASEPHLVAYYVQDLIARFHSYYSRNKQHERVIGPDEAKTQARLLLCQGLAQTLAALLGLLGVSAPDEMHLEETDELA